MLVLGVTWIAREGKDQEMAEVFRKLAAESRREPGCQMYVAHQAADNPRWFYVYEQYLDETALEKHRRSAHFQRYAAKELPALGERIEAHLMRPL